MSTRSTAIAALALAISFAIPACSAQTFVGFDLNLYPGDAQLPALHKNLAYAGYWLNNPPGAPTNQWKGKRSILVQNGFGFLVLFNGHLDADFRRLDPVATGRADAAKAIAAAAAEGFPAQAIIFLDIEEGGRMLPRTAKYVGAWVDALRHSTFRPGVYCSGQEVDDDPGVKISTADDIRHQFGDVALWLANDACPPAPGCSLATGSPHMESLRPRGRDRLAVRAVAPPSRVDPPLRRHLRQGW